MTREEKIAGIYKEMASKEVAFGCRYEHDGSRYVVDSGNYRLMKHGDSYYLYIDAHCNCPIEIVKLYNDFSSQGVVKIIGHPVMIGDVLRQIRLLAGYALDNDLIKKSDFGNVIAQHNYRITQIWENFREPIEAQSDECIDYVYSLIQKD